MRSMKLLDSYIIVPLLVFFTISSFCMAAYMPWNISIFRHILLWIIGFGFMSFLHMKNYTFYIKVAKIMWVLSIVLLCITLFKGTVLKGSKRWIYILGFSLQPSEILKTSSVIICSDYIFNKKFKEIFLVYFIGFVFLIMQPDFGSILLLIAILMIQLIVSDVKMKYIMRAFMSGLSIVLIAVLSLSHVKTRIFSFVFGGKSILEGGYQGFRSIQTIMNGKLFGTGLGKGVMKNYLPDAYSDFIFSVVGEELGIIGCLMIVCIFLFIGFRSLKNSKVLVGEAEYILNVTCVSLILLQAWINIASALWIIPTKGITLPFISHGGSSLLVSLWTMAGLFISSKKAVIKNISCTKFNNSH